jgi:diguanylate cyclase (GGDEF)-like protein
VDFSMNDLLTGLPTCDELFAGLKRELARGARGQMLFSIALLDLDRMKQLNRHYGYAKASVLLKEYGQTLGNCVREPETVARYGGDEFVILLPDRDAEPGFCRMLQLLKSVHKLLVRQSSHALAHVRASAGGATFPVNGTTTEDIVKAADAALSEAKRRGGNKVVWSPS